MKLYPHQESIVSQGLPILRNYKLLYLAMEVRTGKTLTSLTIADQFCNNERVLFITTLKTIPSIKKDYAAMNNPKFTLEVINFEGIHKVATSNVALFIIDEAHKLGQFPKPSQRTKALKEIINGRPCILLSGSPNPESYSQLFHQLFVTGNSPFEHTNFYKWAHEFVNIKKKFINGMQMNDYKSAKSDLVKQAIGHLVITCSQENAGFKAEVEEKIIVVPSNDFAKHIYKTLEKDLVYELSTGVILADTPVNLINKLSQIAGGTVITDTDNTVVVDDSKIKYIQHNYAGKRIAIYYKYKGELALLAAAFKAHTTDWQAFERGESDVFLSQIQSGREGISLKSADYLLMYNIDFSATSYWQVRARLQQRDKAEASKVHWLFSDLGIENYIYKAVTKKKNFTSSYYLKINGSGKQNSSTDNKTTGKKQLASSENNSLEQNWYSRSSLPKERQIDIPGSKESRELFNTTTTVPTRRVVPDWL